MRLAFSPELHVKGRLRALWRGVVACGDEPLEASPFGYLDASVAVASSWRGALELYAMGYPRVVLCECGYLGNRNAWHSLSLDGLNGRGLHAEALPRPEPELAPWRTAPSGYALILGQVPSDWAVRLALGNRPYEDWLQAVELEVHRKTRLEVRVRPHPEVYMLQPNPPSSQRALLEELAGARLAVTLNSTAAIEAVAAGVPTLVYDTRGCMAGAVSANFGPRLYEEPENRRAWINRLARLQWSSEELENGEAWSIFKEVIRCKS